MQKPRIEISVEIEKDWIRAFIIQHNEDGVAEVVEILEHLVENKERLFKEVAKTLRERFANVEISEDRAARFAWGADDLEHH